MLAAVLAVRLVDETGAFVLPGTFEPLRAELDLGYAAASTSFLLIALGAVAGSAATLAADVRSRRVIASGGAAGYAVALLLIGVASSGAGLFVGAFVLGVASTAMVDTSEIVLADIAGDDLERHLTTQNVLASAGDLLGPAIVVASLGAGLSWRVCFAVAAALCVAYSLWLARLPFPPPHRVGGDEAPSRRAVLRDGRVWLASGALLLLGPLDEPLLAFFIAHLESARGLSAAGATAVASASIVGAFGGYASLRVLPGALGRDALALAVAVSAMVVAPEAVTATAASAASGVALARFWTCLQALVLRLRPGQAGAVKAFANVVETAGWALPVLAGAVADGAGVTSGLATYAAIAWVLVAAAFALQRRSSRSSSSSS